MLSALAALWVTKRSPLAPFSIIIGLIWVVDPFHWTSASCRVLIGRWYHADYIVHRRGDFWLVDTTSCGFRLRLSTWGYCWLGRNLGSWRVTLWLRWCWIYTYYMYIWVMGVLYEYWVSSWLYLYYVCMGYTVYLSHMLCGGHVVYLGHIEL